MNERPPDSLARGETLEPENSTAQLSAVWHSKEHNQPVTVIGSYGQDEDGREYLKVANFDAGIPADEVWFTEEKGWLDPRRIQELKASYEDTLSKNAEFDSMDPSKDFKGLIKAKLIEEEIRKMVHAGEYALDNYGVGKIPEPPSEAAKERMAAMMDWSKEALQKMANAADEQPKEHNFKDNQKVNLIINGEKNEGWIVTDPARQFGPETFVGVAKKVGRRMDERYIRLEELREQQERADNKDVKAVLEAIKPYFGKKVNVKVGDEIIKGKDPAVSTKGEVYVHFDVPKRNKEGEEQYDNEGNPILEVKRITVSKQEFLDTQKQKTAAEVWEDKIAEYEGQVEQYVGRNVWFKDNEQNWHNNFKCLEYLKDKKAVRLQHESGQEYPPVPLHQFMEWQQEKGLIETEVEEDTAQEPEEAEVTTEETGVENGEAETEIDIQTPLSFWEKTKSIFDKLPNPVKVAAGFLGLVAFTSGPGLVVGGGIYTQHKLHHRKLKKDKNKQNLG